ncbi:hypothetical protein [Nocardioides sp. GCM10030258]|uniref:hypothetical protein n=1 Tax=unclassified Nocardioides TaxID=2615069 RepID=UPI003620B38F
MGGNWMFPGSILVCSVFVQRVLPKECAGFLNSEAVGERFAYKLEGVLVVFGTFERVASGIWEVEALREKYGRRGLRSALLAGCEQVSAERDVVTCVEWVGVVVVHGCVAHCAESDAPS